jgi:hypothetical protein
MVPGATETIKKLLKMANYRGMEAKVVENFWNTGNSNANNGEIVAPVTEAQGKVKCASIGE